MRRVLMSAALAVLAGATAAAPAVAAPDKKPPRIVSAVMQDADRDGRADAVRVTYSERVRHARDRDGNYPFRVAGYRVRAVGAARGKVVPITLVERTAADAAARPAITYRRTRRGAVVDRARNQARPQTFRATRPHGNRNGDVNGNGNGNPGLPTAADRDGDGFPDAQDCGPDDPAINPAAADLPDRAFTDTNCDGIDGDVNKSIFVSPDGNDNNPGTREQPKREINAAVALAATSNKDVLAAAGLYQRVTVLPNVGIYGGYAPNTWERSTTLVTTIMGAPEAIFAEKATGVVLQLLRVSGNTTQVKLPAGMSFYGIRALAGSNLTLQRVAVSARSGTAGSLGEKGQDGAGGQAGKPGGKGQCDGGKAGVGGAGGKGAGGRAGGSGGNGGRAKYGAAGTGRPGEKGTPNAAGGKGGPPGDPGRDGTNGESGLSGAEGVNGKGAPSAPTALSPIWTGRAGTAGGNGTDGQAGGGGGGGGGGVCTLCLAGAGNGGGGGGGAGGGGKAGAGGGPGGGSFGLYLIGSTATVTDGTTIESANGGEGGRGGDGGRQGRGGVGGTGSSYCKSELGEGGHGGDGGSGGHGGGGGGGAGGPSVGVLMDSESTSTISPDSSVKNGAPGAGGAGGAGGSTPAPSGATAIAQPIVSID